MQKEKRLVWKKLEKKPHFQLDIYTKPKFSENPEDINDKFLSRYFVTDFRENTKLYTWTEF